MINSALIVPWSVMVSFLRTWFLCEMHFIFVTLCRRGGGGGGVTSAASCKSYRTVKLELRALESCSTRLRGTRPGPLKSGQVFLIAKACDCLHPHLLSLSISFSVFTEMIHYFFVSKNFVTFFIDFDSIFKMTYNKNDCTARL